MEWLLFIALIIIEIGFAAYEVIGKRSKKLWWEKRFIVNVAEIFVYLIMLFFPGIDFSFRWKGLVIILIMRIMIAGFFAFINRKNESEKNKICLLFGSFGSILILIISMIPAFIFEDYAGRPVTGPYGVAHCDAILIDSQRVEEFETDGSYREVPVHFFYPESVASLEADSLPLIIFSHGAFGYYQSNTSTYMELASNGYVVVSLDHPYHSFFTKDTNGKTILVDKGFFQDAMEIGSKESDESAVYEATSTWINLREADMNFALDTIQNADETKEFGSEWYIPEGEQELKNVFKCIDSEKVGLMGHSLGGATAVTVGRREDVSAVIDFDGTMLGEEIGVEGNKVLLNETTYDTPILCFDSESHHADRVKAKNTGYVYVNNVIMENATTGYSTYFEGAQHMNFTDLPLFSPLLAKNLGMGKVDPEECIDRINQITLDFFNTYLKGEGEFNVNEKY